MKTALLTLLLTSAASAQIDVSVSPPRLELTVPPGGASSESVSILSEGQGDRVTVALEDFVLTPEGEAVFMPAQSLPTSLCPYLTVLPSSLELVAGERAEVTVQTRLPADAEGLYSCVVFFRTTPEPQGGGGVQLRFAGEVGLTVYATASGSERRDGTISELEVSPEALRLVFENRGNTLLRPSGAVRLVDAQGEEVAELPLDEFPVLPESYHEVRLELPDLQTGRYAAFALLEAGEASFAAEGVLVVP